MAINRRLEIPILLATLPAECGDGFQLCFRKVRTPFDKPRLTQIFPHFGISGIEGDSALIIADTLIRTPQFARGVAPIIPCFSRIAIFQRIEQIQGRLILALFAR